MGKEVARDALVGAERKAHAMQNGLEEARTLLEQADKNRRATEMELSDVNEALSDASVQNQSIAAAKRKLESEMQTLHADLDEMSSEARLCEDKASKAMVDAARLADELRCEQEQAQNLEKGRHFGDAQVKDMQSKLDESETNALKGGKKAMNKLDSRVRELESELESENRRSADSQENLSVASRSCPLPLMRIVRIMRGCKAWLTNSKPKLNPTRSKLKKLKKLLPSTWLNSAKFKAMCLRPLRLPTLMNKPLEKPSMKVWESGDYHTIQAMEKFMETADKDNDLHVTSEEIVAARDSMVDSDAHYQFLDWAEHHEL